MLGLHRFVEMDASVAGDLAQGLGGDVSGQDDGRDLVWKLALQARDDFEAADIARQVVVGDHQSPVASPR